MTKRLTLYNFDELKAVKDYKQITAIRINNYYSIADFEPLLRRCVHLQELHLLRGFLRPEVPAFLPLFPQLHTLVLKDIPIEPILPLLAQLPALRRLELQKQQFSSFPDVLLQLPQLEELSFQGSSFADTAIDWAILQQLPRLRHLNLYQVNLLHTPSLLKGLTALTALRELVVSKRLYTLLQKEAADFCTQVPYLYSHSSLEKKYFSTLLNSCRTHQWDGAYRSVLMNLLAQQTDKLAQQASEKLVLQATDILLLEPLRLQALEYYQMRWGVDIDPKQLENAGLAVVGNLSIDKRQLRRQLNEQGIRYRSKLTADCRYLLLGQRAQGAYTEALEKNIPILTEKAVVQYLAQQENAYLTQPQEEPVDLAHLEALLCSGQAVNVQLALTLFERGGFPPSLLTALFWAHQLVEERKTKRALERLLGQHASIELLEHIKSKQLVFAPYSFEAGIKRRLKQLEPFSELDVPKLAQYGYQRYSKGLVYLLTALPKAEALRLLHTRLSADAVLNLSRHELTTIPSIVFRFSAIKTLDLSYNNQLKTISIKGLRQLPNLQHLVIYGNSKLRNKEHWVLSVAEQLPDLQVYYYNLPH